MCGTLQNSTSLKLDSCRGVAPTDMLCFGGHPAGMVLDNLSPQREKSMQINQLFISQISYTFPHNISTLMGAVSYRTTNALFTGQQETFQTDMIDRAHHQPHHTMLAISLSDVYICTTKSSACCSNNWLGALNENATADLQLHQCPYGRTLIIKLRKAAGSHQGMEPARLVWPSLNESHLPQEIIVDSPSIIFLLLAG